jgi:PAS domain S-box-containing protein
MAFRTVYLPVQSAGFDTIEAFGKRSVNPIAARVLRLGLPLGLLVIGGGVLVEEVIERSERNLLESRQNAGLDLAASAFTSDLASVDSDLAAVSTFDEVEPALDPSITDAPARLARAFLTFARSKRVYAQVRLLGSDGRERVRVNYRDGLATIVPDDALEDKKDRPYFSEAIDLPPGAVYVSPIDLHVEKGAVSEPLTPTVRFSTPVDNDATGVKGVVVINYLARHALDSLGRAGGAGILLVDEAGFFLRGRVPEEEWGDQLPGRAGKRFGALFPDAWESVRTKESGVVDTVRGLFAFRTIRPSSFLGRSGGGGGPWKIVSMIPAAEVRVIERRFLGLVAILDCAILTLIAIAFFIVASRQIQSEEAELHASNQLRDVEKRSVEALRSSEMRTRALLDNMLSGLLMVNDRGIIEFANPAAERIFGYASGELIGRLLHQLVPERPGLDAGLFLREAVGKAMGRVTEWEGRRNNGDVFPFELALFQFDTPEGRRIAGSFVDVTERREVDRLKREFVSSISHELRTPLTSIRGSLGLLAGGVLGPLPREAAEIVAVAERNAVRLIALINDILDLERLEGGRLEMEIETAEAAAIVTRAFEAVQTFADQSGVSIVKETTSIRVRADADRLIQVLVNLVSNAVKFSKAGDSVAVRVAAAAGMAEFQVEDHGRGVPPALREVIFERYRQVEASDSRRKGGAGLGLAICKAIVEQHGGAIGVRDTEGGGSVFWFRIPMASQPRLSTSGSVLGARGLALLVDDDEELLSILELRLAQDRIATQRATTAEEAIATARALKPDVLVLDLGLPGGDGSQVVEALRSDPTLGRMPLLVYTARDLQQVDRDRLVLGPTRFLTKSRETGDEFRSIVLDLLEKGPGGPA